MRKAGDDAVALGGCSAAIAACGRTDLVAPFDSKNDLLSIPEQNGAVSRS